MGEHQLTIRNYLRHGNLNVTNQYLQATSKTRCLAQRKLVDAILPTGLLSAGQVDAGSANPARLSIGQLTIEQQKPVLLEGSA